MLRLTTTKNRFEIKKQSSGWILFMDTMEKKFSVLNDLSKFLQFYILREKMDCKWKYQIKISNVYAMTLLHMNSASEIRPSGQYLCWYLDVIHIPKLEIWYFLVL